VLNEKPRELLHKVDNFLTEKLKAYDDLKNVVTLGLPASLANDINKLRREREKVLQHLGEQTFLLLQQGKLIVPGIVQMTYRTAQEIVERIVRIESDDVDLPVQMVPQRKEVRVEAAPRAEVRTAAPVKAPVVKKAPVAKKALAVKKTPVVKKPARPAKAPAAPVKKAAKKK